jgi:tellurite resistance protein TehA-like permease
MVPLFSFVMATGILSVAASREDLPAASAGLIAVAAAALALGAVPGLRAAASELRAAAPGADPGLLTLVAGTGVVGTRVAAAGDRRWIALGLLAVAVAAWIALLPAVVRRLRASPLRDARGAWLLVTVATQSLAALAATLAPLLGSTGLRTAADCLWALGAAAYVAIAAALGLRLVRASLDPGRLTPDWWIASGAASITAVAGSAIEAVYRGAPGIPRTGTIGAWALATALIPPLVLAEWRRVTATGSLAGDLPNRYATVFPLGMYAVATDDVHRLIGGEVLAALTRAGFWIAAAAWLTVGATLAMGRVAHTAR